MEKIAKKFTGGSWAQFDVLHSILRPHRQESDRIIYHHDKRQRQAGGCLLQSVRGARGRLWWVSGYAWWNQVDQDKLRVRPKGSSFVAWLRIHQSLKVTFIELYTWRKRQTACIRPKARPEHAWCRSNKSLHVMRWSLRERPSSRPIVTRMV